MSFQYTTGDPDNLVGGTVANMLDIQGPFVDLKAFLNQRIAAIPALVTNLPAGPVDGQEVYYLADSANGVVWHLRYRSTSGSTYKWEFVGGAPLTSEVLTAETTVSTTYVDLATVGPQVTVPLAGDYEIVFSATTSSSAVNASNLVAVKLGAAAASGNDGVQMTSATTNAAAAVATVLRRNLAAASSVVKVQYRVSAGTGVFLNRELAVRPVRVG